MSWVHRIVLATVLGWQAACFARGAAQSSAQPPRFPITRFAVEGATLMTSEEIDAALQPFTGTERTLADAQRARAALEAAYAQRGYGATQVVLPAQEITDGTVRLRAIEGRVSGVSIEGNRYFDAANIRRSVPGLAEGQCRHLGVRQSTLMSRFQRAGLPSPKAYLAGMRLLHIAWLLENPGMSVADAAYRMDFSSPQSLGRHLKAMLGLTAGEFRQRFPFEVALTRYVDLLVTPYREALRALHPFYAGQRDQGPHAVAVSRAG